MHAFLSERVSASSQVCVAVHTCVSVFESDESHSRAWVLCLSLLMENRGCLETGCDVHVFVC